MESILEVILDPAIKPAIYFFGELVAVLLLCLLHQLLDFALYFSDEVIFIQFLGSEFADEFEFLFEEGVVVAVVDDDDLPLLFC